MSLLIKARVADARHVPSAFLISSRVADYRHVPNSVVAAVIGFVKMGAELFTSVKMGVSIFQTVSGRACK